MSVVILGGHERLEREYKDLCKEYDCRAKVFTRADGGLKKKLGNPDLAICFTQTMSHKMLRGVKTELKSRSTIIAHCHNSSVGALRDVLLSHLTQAT